MSSEMLSSANTKLKVNVGHHGADPTSVELYEGDVLTHSENFPREDLSQTVDRVRALYDHFHPQTIEVDTTGRGWGVLDRLKEFDLPAIGAKPSVMRATRAQLAFRWALLGVQDDRIAVRLECEIGELDSMPNVRNAIQHGRETYERKAKLATEDQALLDKLLADTGCQIVEVDGKSYILANGRYSGFHPPCDIEVKDGKIVALIVVDKTRKVGISTSFTRDGVQSATLWNDGVGVFSK